ncbi:hypothetical protein Pcaca04_24200 [Pectobacterium carotovorum subsp. carotovorum]|nr:hypothetical protein Pcaca04_24200 [Pectobacterium carotovorum subsp. carotovorum]
MSDFYNYGINYGFQNRCFAVLKKRDVYVAVYDQYSNILNGGFNEQSRDLQSQGFVLWRTIWAVNSRAAIEEARALDEQDLIKLTAENDSLKQEIQRLKGLIHNNQSISDIDPYLVFGFKPGVIPSAEQIKAKRKKLAFEFHSDRGGSDFLMQLINSAWEKLKK